MEKLIKCILCKNIVEDSDLFQIISKDKNGNIENYKNGNHKFKSYHNKCYEEKVSREMLFDYINDRFFYKNSPSQMWNYLNNIRNSGEKFNRKKLVKQGYEFLTIYNCFISIESELIPSYKRTVENNGFNDDLHKVNFIIFYLMKHLDTFARNKQCKKAIKKLVENQEEITNSSSNTIEINTKKKKNKYEINPFVGG